jgi:S1-C subfamily serine protease
MRLTVFLLLVSSALFSASSPFGAGAGNGGGRNASPFSTGSSYDDDKIIKTVDFDVARVGVPGRVETRDLFIKVWAKFRDTYELTDDGSFTIGSEAIPDTAFTQNAFLHFLSKNTPEVYIKEKTKCVRCDGRGTKPTVENYGGVSRSVTIDCDLCNGRGGETGIIVYRLTYTGKLPERMTPPPRTPRAESRDSSSTKRATRTFYGSGMVFTKQGHIFTNQHVISGADAIFIVRYENGMLADKLPAKLVKMDPKSDLAILQCADWKAPKGAPSTPPLIVSTRSCKLGDSVFVLGFPLPGTVSSNVKYTKGDISDLSGVEDDSSKIQHTTPIQPGNSGGPMCLNDGRVVGIVVSSLNPGYTLARNGSIPQGVNFSVKSDYLITLAGIADVEIPKDATTESTTPVEHVKAYTVQIISER